MLGGRYMCDPIWHVSSHRCVVMANCYICITLLYLPEFIQTPLELTTTLGAVLERQVYHLSR